MLINRALYRHGQRVSELEAAGSGPTATSSDCFVWVALHDASEEELAAFQAEFDLPDLAVEDALHGHQRAKVEEYENCLFAVAHMLEAGADGGIQVGQLAVFAGRQFVVSVRRDSSADFAGIRARAEREPELLGFGAGYVLYALLDAVVDRYFPIVERLEAELDAVEEEIFSAVGPGRENVERLYALKQKTTLVKHAVAPLLHDLGKLHGGRVPSQVSAVQDYIRDVADHLARINSSIDSLRDTIGTAVQVNLSLATINDATVMKRLAAWAAIFAVWTSFAGLWGMNFEFMPELKWTYGYPLALLVIAGTCAGLYRRFKQSGWL